MKTSLHREMLEKQHYGSKLAPVVADRQAAAAIVGVAWTVAGAKKMLEDQQRRDQRRLRRAGTAISCGDKGLRHMPKMPRVLS